MSENPERVARIREALATSHPDDGLREALQVVADGICEIAGFGVAAANVVRDGRWMETVAVSSDDSQLQWLVGTSNPVGTIEAELERGENWGRFYYVPADKQARLAPYSWVPETTFPDVENAWNPEDLLIAPLYDGDTLAGLLSVDLPPGGLVPGPEQRDILNAYAEQAERVLVRALERDRTSTQLRLAETARDVVRNASRQMSIQEVLAGCRGDILAGFRAEGLWAQSFSDRQIRAHTENLPQLDDLPEQMFDLIHRVARAAWEQNIVGRLSANYGLEQLLSQAERATSSAFLDEVGFGSAMFIPLGAGEEALGCLMLVRDAAAGDWTDAEARAALDIGHDLGFALANAQLFHRRQELVTRLQELDVYKSDLIEAIVHELRNPLMVITGSLEMLTTDASPEAVARIGSAIDRGAHRIAGLVDRLLELDRVCAPPPAGSTQSCGLADCVSEAVALLRPQAEVRHITVSVLGEEDLPQVRGSVEDIHLLVTNLVGNAIKYGRRGGSVVLAMAHLPDDGSVRVSVHDDGTGIDAEDLPRVFEEFFRSSRAADDAIAGSGLGLAIVSRIVERVGATIRVESTEGVGTTFTVDLSVAS